MTSVCVMECCKDLNGFRCYQREVVIEYEVVLSGSRQAHVGPL